MIVYTEDEINAAALAYFRVTFQNSATPIDLSDRSFAAYSLGPSLAFGCWHRARSCKPITTRFPRISKMPTAICAQNKPRGAGSMGVCLWSAIRRGRRVWRKGPTISTGGVGIPGATLPAVLIPAGTQARDSTGAVVVETVANVTTDGPPNTQPVQLVSVTKGTQANLSAGTTLMVCPTSGHYGNDRAHVRSDISQGRRNRSGAATTAFCDASKAHSAAARRQTTGRGLSRRLMSSLAQR